MRERSRSRQIVPKATGYYGRPPPRPPANRAPRLPAPISPDESVEKEIESVVPYHSDEDTKVEGIEDMPQPPDSGRTMPSAVRINAPNCAAMPKHVAVQKAPPPPFSQFTRSLSKKKGACRKHAPTVPVRVKQPAYASAQDMIGSDTCAWRAPTGKPPT